MCHNLTAASRQFAFELDPGNCVDNVKLFRAALKTDGDAYEWIASYGLTTNTSWIVDWEVPNPKRLVFHKKWKCKRSCRNKTSGLMSTDCPAFVDIKIKKSTKDTKRRDPFLNRAVPLPAVIRLREDHNHALGGATELRLLPSTPDTRAVFLSYFRDGLSPAESIALHVQKLGAEPNGTEKLASGAINPKTSSVYHWFGVWRQQQFDTTADPLTKVEENAAFYLEKEANVRTTKSEDGSSWAVLVVSKIMERVQELNAAREAVFVESTASFDGSEHAVTVVLAASPVGALPLAVLLHSSQNTESYKVAFGLLKRTYPFCFGGAHTPQAFVTDNLEAERAALQATWPSTTQFLSHFHVTLAEWHWLQASCDISRDDRRELMVAFQKIMYASSATDLNSALVDLRRMPHNEYVSRGDALLEQQMEWVLLFRSGTATRGLSETSFAEASVRILKDAVLSWCEVYDAAALVDFVTTVLEEHFRKRLVEHAYNRVPAGCFLYDSLLQRMPDSVVQAIRTLGSCTFHVPGEEQDEMHEVWQAIGSCTCQAGQNGAFCKHQAIVHRTFGGGLPDAPNLTAQDRFLLAGLALGDVKCQEFFSDLQESLLQRPCSSTSVEEGSMIATEHLPQVDHVMQVKSELDMEGQTLDHQRCEDAAELLKQIQEEQWRHYSVAARNPSYLNALQRLLAEMKKVRTEPQVVAMHLATEAAYARVMRRRARVMKARPTGASRRRPAVTRGTSRVHGGCASRGLRNRKSGASHEEHHEASH